MGKKGFAGAASGKKSGQGSSDKGTVKSMSGRSGFGSAGKVTSGKSGSGKK